MDLADCNVTIDQLDREVVSVTKYDLENAQSQIKNQISLIKSRTQLVSLTEKHITLNQSESPDYVRSYESSKKSIDHKELKKE